MPREEPIRTLEASKDAKNRRGSANKFHSPPNETGRDPSSISSADGCVNFDSASSRYAGNDPDGGFSGVHKPLIGSETQLKILVEIVSAWGLTSLPRVSLSGRITAASDASRSSPFCVARYGGQEVHRTKPLHKTLEPVWTVKSNSLFIFTTTVEKLKISQGLVFEVLNAGENFMKSRSSKYSHGAVTLSPRVIMKSKGQRKEFKLNRVSMVGKGATAIESDSTCKLKGMLALRFRCATSEEEMFVEKLYKTKKTAQNLTGKSNSLRISAPDVCCTPTPSTKPPKGHRRSIKNKGGEEMFRVQPYPDAKNLESTMWMTKSDLQKTCMLPSSRWVHAGAGDGSGGLGRLYLEILSCDNLPNMDISYVRTNVTDPLVAIIFENSFVKTDVIHDTLSPKWMPWSQRAFAFHIMHPCSILSLGVFDYDEGPLNDHDPIGRIVINLSSLSSGMIYLLQYELNQDPNSRRRKAVGTISVRLRLEWVSERLMMARSFTRPPRCFVNVDSGKQFRMVRYICNGEINMRNISYSSVYMYWTELKSHIEQVEIHVVDATMEVLLWRGHATVRLLRPSWVSADSPHCDVSLVNKFNNDDRLSKNFIEFRFWMPIHSLALFLAGTTVAEQPTLLPSYTMFACSWIMLTIMYRRSRHPCPWRRCKSLLDIMRGIFPFSPNLSSVVINENEGAQKALALKAAAEAKRERVNIFLAAIRSLNESQLEMDDIRIETEESEWRLPFSDKLYYAHLGLSILCRQARVVRNIVTWRESSYAFILTMGCLIVGIVLLFVPWVVLFTTILRAIVWTLLGPWMKFADILLIRRFSKANKGNVEIDVLESVWGFARKSKVAQLTRIAKENALKLQHMRQYQFGEFTTRVPPHDISRFIDFPLSQSRAIVYESSCNAKGGEAEVHYLPDDQLTWTRKPGQQLYDSMVHTSDRTHATAYG